MIIAYRDNEIFADWQKNYDKKTITEMPYGYKLSEIPDDIDAYSVKAIDIEDGKFNLEGYSQRITNEKLQLANRIKTAEIKKELVSLSEDFIQYQVGEDVPDLLQRKQRFIALHNQLRELEGKTKRQLLNNTL